MSTAPSTPENDLNLSGLGRALLDTGGSKPSGPWVPPTAEELQKLLPQYEITALLGRGGMGAVYKGTQIALDRPVAIKILSNQLEEADASFAERFKNEARAMAKLSHPGIVGVYDFGETAGGQLYIVMEFIEGTDVAKMLAQQKRLHTEHAMAITAHVCDALAYAHERGIIHRDIKPANIMVGYDGVVKVADFGLAKMSSANAQSGLTQSGMAMGTLHYMAPEALMLGAGVDHRADIYAVGVMLYQMLTGKIPQGLFELPSLQVPGLDPRYDGIISKALREDRDLRYPRVLDMRHDLDAILTQPVVKVEAAAQRAPAALETQARPQRPGGQPYHLEPTQPQMLMHPEKKGAPLLWVALIVFGAAAAWMYWEWSKTKGVAGSLVAGASNASSEEGWERIMNTPASFTKTDMVEMKDGWVIKKLNATNGTHASSHQATDAAFRAEFRGTGCSLVLRNDYKTAGKRFQLLRTDSALELSVLTGYKDTGGTPTKTVLKAVPMQPPGADESYLMEFRMQAGWITAKLNGAEVIRVPDNQSRYPGRLAVFFQNSDSKARNMEWINLDGTDAVASTASSGTPPSSPISETTIKIDDAFVKANVLGTSWRTHYTNDSRYDTLEFKSTGNEVVKKASVGGQQLATWSIEDGGSTLKVTTLDKSGFYFLLNFTSNNTADLQFIKVKTISMVGIISKIAGPKSAPVSPATLAATAAASTPQPSPAATSSALKIPAPVGAPPNTLKKVTQLIATGVSERRPVGAAWKSVNGEWLSAVDDNSAGIQFPHKLVAQDYDYEVEFSFSDENGGSLHQRVPANGKVLEWVMPFAKAAAGQRYEITGLSPTAAATTMPSLVAGKRYRSVVQVRQGSISAIVDGQTLIQFQGDPGQGKDVPNRLLDPKLLSLTVGKAAVTLHRVQITEFIPATVDLTKPPATGWKPMFPDLKKFKESTGVTEMIGGGFKLDKAALYPCNARDLAVRARIKNGSSVQLVARALDDSAKPISKYWAGFFSKDNSVVLFRQWNDNGKGGGPRMANITLATSILTTPPKQDDEYVLTLLVYGDQLRVFMNDELIVEKKDSLLQGSFAGIIGTGEVRDLEWVTLPQDAPPVSTTPAAKITATATLPAAPTTWTDTKGRNLVATFKGIQGDNVMLEVAGKVTPVAMNTLSEASQKQARYDQLQARPAPLQNTSNASLTNTLGMKFVPVAGTNVIFCIHETRKKDYAAFAMANPDVADTWKNVVTTPEGIAVSDGDDHPVANVSWDEAKAFCAWLKKVDGRSYRLPTDREWSFAVRMGKFEKEDRSPKQLNGMISNAYPWGGKYPVTRPSGNYADLSLNSKMPTRTFIDGYTDGFVTTAPVMSFAPDNTIPGGFKPPPQDQLYDLGGNVEEWCEDWFDETNTQRVLRGGSWADCQRKLLKTYRNHKEPDQRTPTFGFRVVIEVATP